MYKLVDLRGNLYTPPNSTKRCISDLGMEQCDWSEGYKHGTMSIINSRFTVESSPGVWLLLDGQLYANKSVIELRNVFESSDDSHSLMCVTPKRPCCGTRPNRHGEWFYPNQSTVSFSETGNSFYITRRDDGTVRLHRRGFVLLTAAVGQYCCQIPNANDITQRLCVHFGK